MLRSFTPFFPVPVHTIFHGHIAPYARKISA
jgi:hypothetical protein